MNLASRPTRPASRRGRQPKSAGQALVDGVRAGVRETAIDAVWRDVSVVAAQLGDQAELLGAVGLALAEIDADMLLSTAA